MELYIRDDEIIEVEKILLPTGCHFADDAISVIRQWKSCDVAACPGSGKTTVLLAKLKLLADRMPFADGAGVCVLSHTNVAINEIKNKFRNYSEKLFGYPNYIGTIQAFIDRFITIPYLREKSNQSIHFVDGKTYANHFVYKLKNHPFLCSTVNKHYNACNNDKYDSIESYVEDLYINSDGSLCVKTQRNPIAGKTTQTVCEFEMLKTEILVNDGLVKYEDTYDYALKAINSLSSQYLDLFSKRFKYVFIDEYQDCTTLQRTILDKLFCGDKNIVVHIGDPDQAIYKTYNEDDEEWIPKNPQTISSTIRFPQAIATWLSPMRKSRDKIISKIGEDGNKPFLIIYDENTIKEVLSTFITILDKCGLYDTAGVYKAVGAVRKKSKSGISIGSYWDGFNKVDQQRPMLNYWDSVDDICGQLSKGCLYLAEKAVMILICRLFRYANIKDKNTNKVFTVSSLRKALYVRCKDKYCAYIMKLIELNIFNRVEVDKLLRIMLADILQDTLRDGKNIYDYAPSYYMQETPAKDIVRDNASEFIDQASGRKIVFDTVHGVKGETHDATLYLETTQHGSSDIHRILQYYGVLKSNNAKICESNRKVVYVGMSRPRKLLCLAIRDSTYKKGASAFVNWDIVDITTANNDNKQ